MLALRRAALLALLLACGDAGGPADPSATATPPTTAPATGDDPGTAASGPASTGDDDPTTGAATTSLTSSSSSSAGSTGPEGTGTSADPGTTAVDPGTTGPGSTGDVPVDPGVNIDPSNGSGGAIAPGTTGTTPLGADIYIPPNYDPATLASPVIWLFNETIPQWQAATAADAAILVDLKEYNDTQKIVAKLNETSAILETEYNVDLGRYYWAGWSAGGNLVVIIGSANQQFLAGTMVFPGTGGQYAKDNLAGWGGHKMRLYYACGSEDPNFDDAVVKNEADSWAAWYGYETRFDLVEGAPHYLDEAIYGVRADAWQWMRGFNLAN